MQKKNSRNLNFILAEEYFGAWGMVVAVLHSYRCSHRRMDLTPAQRHRAGMVDVIVVAEIGRPVAWGRELVGRGMVVVGGGGNDKRVPGTSEQCWWEGDDREDRRKNRKENLISGSSPTSHATVAKPPQGLFKRYWIVWGLNIRLFRRGSNVNHQIW